MTLMTTPDAAVIPAAFDYECLDAEARIVARQKATEIRELYDGMKRSAVKIGQRLRELKPHLRGQWGAWVKAEMGWSDETANNYIALAALVEDRPEVALVEDRIARSALLALAAPSTPDRARADILARAAEGPVSHKEARQIIAAHKAPAPPALPDLPPELVAAGWAWERDGERARLVQAGSGAATVWCLPSVYGEAIGEARRAVPLAPLPMPTYQAVSTIKRHGWLVLRLDHESWSIAHQIRAERAETDTAGLVAMAAYLETRPTATIDELVAAIDDDARGAQGLAPLPAAPAAAPAPHRLDAIELPPELTAAGVTWDRAAYDGQGRYQLARADGQPLGGARARAEVAIDWAVAVIRSEAVLAEEATLAPPAAPPAAPVRDLVVAAGQALLDDNRDNPAWQRRDGARCAACGRLVSDCGGCAPGDDAADGVALEVARAAWGRFWASWVRADSPVWALLCAGLFADLPDGLDIGRRQGPDYAAARAQAVARLFDHAWQHHRAQVVAWLRLTPRADLSRADLAALPAPHRTLLPPADAPAPAPGGLADVTRRVEALERAVAGDAWQPSEVAGDLLAVQEDLRALAPRISERAWGALVERCTAIAAQMAGRAQAGPR